MIAYKDIPHYIRIAIQKIHEGLSTAAMRLVVRYWGISVGHGCTFVGSASFVRCRGSRIEIGSHGRFLSAIRSNRHGLNRPVMITTLRPKAEIVIGSGVGMSGTVICAAQSVRIGERVMLGANTTVSDTDSHPIGYRERHAAYYDLDSHLADSATQIAPIIIEDDVFVGMHAIILKGVTIGRGAVIAAGSVVVRDVPAGSVVAGIPARIIKSAPQDETLRQQNTSVLSNSGSDACLS